MAAEFDLEDLPGVGKVSAEKLREASLDSGEKILAGGVDALVAVEGISEAKAKQIIEYLEEQSVAATGENPE